jgi:hypothetical protein
LWAGPRFAPRPGDMQSITDGGDFFGVGFNILDDRGAPIVSFGCLDPADAAVARAMIQDAIAEAALIAGHK